MNIMKKELEHAQRLVSGKKLLALLKWFFGCFYCFPFFITGGIFLKLHCLDWWIILSLTVNCKSIWLTPKGKNFAPIYAQHLSFGRWLSPREANRKSRKVVCLPL